MGYLSALTRHGVKACIKPGGLLWLEPKCNITERIREVVQTNKGAILAELQSEQAQRASSLSSGACDGRNESVAVQGGRRVESAYGAALEAKLDDCKNCGATVVFWPYDGEAAGWGWWYECHSCDDCRAIESIPAKVPPS